MNAQRNSGIRLETNSVKALQATQSDSEIERAMNRSRFRVCFFPTGMPNYEFNIFSTILNSIGSCYR